MLKLPFISNNKLLLAFEYGVILATTAQKEGIELTPEMVLKAEEMVKNEFATNSATKLAVQMTPNILTVFETDMSQ